MTYFIYRTLSNIYFDKYVNMYATQNDILMSKIALYQTVFVYKWAKFRFRLWVQP